MEKKECRQFIDFDKKIPVLIYGAGELGGMTAQRLIGNGYNVRAFLDKCKSGLENVTGKRIYQMGTERYCCDQGECVVIVCLADGMQHKEVAFGLWKEGYRFIVCLPMNFAVSLMRKVELTNRYNEILEGQNLKEHRIENFELLMSYDLDCYDAVIDKAGNPYIVWVREEILYTEWAYLWKGDREKVQTAADVQNVNIAAYEGGRNLLQYLYGMEEDCEKYWKVSRAERTQREKEEIIEKRERLLRIYEREYCQGLEFFIAGAPNVVWNEKGYWNLHGGHHRTSFLQQRGHVLFPVRMEKEEFDIWCNPEKLRKILRYMNKHNIDKTVVPIPHPAFFNFEAERELIGDTILGKIVRFLKRKLDVNSSVLDCSKMEGYFARNFARSSLRNVVYIGGDEVSFVKMLNELLYVSSVCCFSEKEYNQIDVFSVVFLLNRYDMNIEELLLQRKLEKITGKYLFVEMTAGEPLSPDTLVKKTSFRYYKKLHQEVYKGKMREIGVFVK